MDSTAPAKAPRPAPRRTPLSEARPANAPVNAPVRPPAATGKPNPRQRKKNRARKPKHRSNTRCCQRYGGAGARLPTAKMPVRAPERTPETSLGRHDPVATLRRSPSDAVGSGGTSMTQPHGTGGPPPRLLRKLTRSRSSVTVARVGLGLTQGPVYLMAPARLVDWWLVGTPVVEELAGRREDRRGQGDRRERVTPPENDLPLGSADALLVCSLLLR
jgi:hypothetical protein